MLGSGSGIYSLSRMFMKPLAHTPRPACFDFAIRYLGEPEVLEYVETLEQALANIKTLSESAKGRDEIYRMLRDYQK